MLGEAVVLNNINPSAVLRNEFDNFVSQLVNRRPHVVPNTTWYLKLEVLRRNVNNDRNNEGVDSGINGRALRVNVNNH